MNIQSISESLCFTTSGLVFNDFIPYPDLWIPRGKVTFIVGESGCGKSTLLKLFNTVLSPSAGEIFYRGTALSTRDPIVHRKAVSLISQDSWLFPGTVRDNFERVFSLRNLPCPPDETLLSLCDACRFDIPLDTDTANFSGGERHRLYIALFLGLKPEVLMLDEPTAALDAQTTDALMENLIEFCKKTATDLILVSHDQLLVERFSENTIQLQRGGDTI